MTTQSFDIFRSNDLHDFLTNMIIALLGASQFNYKFRSKGFYIRINLNGKPKQINLIYFVPVSIAVLVAFGFALAFVHEVGHGMVCNWGESNTFFEFAISLTGGGEGRCVGYTGNIEVYRAAGGLLASTISLAIAFGMIIIFRRQFWLSGNYRPAVPIALICLGFGHLLAATLETFSFDFYLGSQVAMYLIQILVFSVLVIATILLHRSRAKLLESRL